MSDSIKPSKPKEAIGRFLAKFTGGKYANNEMLQVRGGKVETAVADVRAEIVRLQGRGVSSPTLNEMLQNLQDARENAFWVKGSGKRYDAMEKVKQGARTAAKTAKEQVDNSLALLSTLPQTSIAAWNAIKEAERVIQGAPNPQQHAQALADLETRRAALSAVTESTELAPAIAGLVQVKTDAWQLAADVATANALAALDEVEAEIGRLQDAGVRSASLDRTYADLRASHALALSGQNEAKRYDDLETVKQMARAATVTAKKQVDNILARLNTHAQTSIAASTAIQQADAAIQETLDPN